MGIGIGNFSDNIKDCASNEASGPQFCNFNLLVDTDNTI